MKEIELDMGKGKMFIKSLLKNKNYIKSRRKFSDDSNVQHKEIDMTLSGRYLYKYPQIDMTNMVFDVYPSFSDIKGLEEYLESRYESRFRVVIGGGTNGIIQNLVKLIFKHKGNLVTPFYTFHQAEYAVTSFGSYTRRVLMDDYRIDFDSIYNSINRKTKMVYICNPNNPTGEKVDTDAIFDLIKKCSDKIIFLIDESSIEFSGGKSITEFDLPDNVIVLRSLSKAYGLANMRIGYMLCSDKLYEYYRNYTTSNEVSGLSCAIAKSCIQSDYYLENVKLIMAESEWLKKSLEQLGIEIYPSSCNTLMTKTIFEKSYINDLFENGVSVVPVEDSDGKLHIRIAVQDRKTNEKFINVFKTILERKKI